ncbi:MAG: hypothetical protein H0U75_04465 [Legionella sp.]|nr:hypothetical protein [Legionella sp.]
MGFTQFLKEIHIHDRRNRQACAALAHELLLVENKTTETCAHAQEKIEDAISRIKQENQKACDESIRQHKNNIKLLLEEQTQKYKAKIAAYEHNYKQQLDALEEDEQRKADERLQTTLKRASEQGEIAKERQKLAEAKIEFEDKRLELAQSDEYFIEIHRMIQLLEGYSSYINREIETKQRWNNRIRWVSVEELNSRFGTRTTCERIGGILFAMTVSGLFSDLVVATGWAFVWRCHLKCVSSAGKISLRSE